MATLSGAAASLGVADLPFDLGGGSTDIDRIDAIVHSRSLSDVVVAKFDLRTRYRAKFVEDARDALWINCATKTEKKAQLLTLSCEDISPAFAQSLVSFLVDEANKTTHRVSASLAGEERRFLETRVAQARTDLDLASQKLRDFQEQHKVVSLHAQAEAVVSSMASLRTELINKQIQLAFVDSYASSDEATSSQLRRQAGLLQAKLDSLEKVRSAENPASTGATQLAKGSKTGSSSSSFFPPAMAMPELQYELEQLLREQKVQETLFGLLTQRFELARVNEARDTSSFQVLDAPTIPTRKTRPLRLMSSLVGMLVGMSIGTLIPSVFGRGAKSRNLSRA